MNTSVKTPVNFQALEQDISSDNTQVASEARLRLHEVANQVNDLTDIAKGGPQTVSDAIIQIMENSSESKEAEPEVVPELEEENFRIDSTGWEEKVGNDGIRYKINPEGDVTEVLEGLYTGDQHFLTREAALRETEKAGKKMPDNTQWSRIIEEGEKRAKEKDIPLYEELGLKLAGYRDWDNGLYDYQGTYGYYWSSTPSTSYSYYAYFGSGGGNIASLNNRGYGFSVRCLKN